METVAIYLKDPLIVVGLILVFVSVLALVIARRNVPLGVLAARYRIRRVPTHFERTALDVHEEHVSGRLALHIRSSSLPDIRHWAETHVGLNVDLAGSLKRRDVDRFTLEGAAASNAVDTRSLAVAYRLEGQPVTLLTTPAADILDRPPEVTSAARRMRLLGTGGRYVLTWTSSGQAYALVSAGPPSVLYDYLAVQPATFLPGVAAVASLPAALIVGVGLIGAGMTRSHVPQGSPEDGKAGPWWNTWVTRRGAQETRSQGVLEPGLDYSFFLELSRLNRGDAGKGIATAPVDPTVAGQLRELFRQDISEKKLTFRFTVVGRAASLLESPDNVAVWGSGQWVSAGTSLATTTATMDLNALFPDAASPRPAKGPDAIAAARAGGIQFGLKAREPGCAAVVASVWDETGTLPLDEVVQLLQVGDGAPCTGTVRGSRAYLGAVHTSTSAQSIHGSIQIVEFVVNGAPRSASFMNLRSHPDGCPFFSWDGDVTVTGLMLNNQVFRESLQDARRTDDAYPVVADQIAAAVFPPDDKQCGASHAWRSLQAMAQSRRPRLLVRVTDRNDQIAVVPLGLLAMSLDRAGQPSLKQEMTVIEPLPRESLQRTPCVDAWTFVLPDRLDGLTLKPPAWTRTDTRVQRSRQKFVDGFLSQPDTTAPVGLLLLAHHEQGVLTFADLRDKLFYSQFTRKYGPGSIAILSACKTASLDDNAAFLRRLNDRGIDAIVTSPFPIDPEFGTQFAYNFAAVVRETKVPLTVGQAFENAMARTVQAWGAATRTTAKGMSLELVLAGNPDLQVCATH